MKAVKYVHGCLLNNSSTALFNGLDLNQHDTAHGESLANRPASITFLRLRLGKIERTLKVLPGCADILFGGAVMLATRVLLVDGDEVVRVTLAGLLEQSCFAITSAANAPDSLKLIGAKESYDLLLTDLYMPESELGSGDALTVVSAMRHTNPGSVTPLLSAFPEMTAAPAAFLQQTDEILVKPVEVT